MYLTYCYMEFGGIVYVIAWRNKALHHLCISMRCQYWQYMYALLQWRQYQLEDYLPNLRCRGSVQDQDCMCSHLMQRPSQNTDCYNRIWRYRIGSVSISSSALVWERLMTRRVSFCGIGTRIIYLLRALLSMWIWHAGLLRFWLYTVRLPCVIYRGAPVSPSLFRCSWLQASGICVPVLIQAGLSL